MPGTGCLVLNDEATDVVCRLDLGALRVSPQSALTAKVQVSAKAPNAIGTDGGVTMNGKGEEPVEDLAQAVAFNLRRLRTRRGHSLERLSKLSGVSRTMLGQIELGHSVPTINLLWKVARALDVPFATLIGDLHIQDTAILPADRAKVLVSKSGQFRSRALFPFDSQRKVEFYELALGV